MLKTVVTELQEALGLEPKPGESQDVFAERLARKANDLKDDEWEGLSQEAQLWVNAGLDAVEKKRSVPLPAGIDEVIPPEGAPKATKASKKAAAAAAKSTAKPAAKPAAKAEAAPAKTNGKVKAKPAAKAAKVAPKSAAKPAGRGPNGKFGKADTIKVVPEKNPFREGSKCFNWFGSIKDGMTIEEAVEAGAPRHHIRWAHTLGHLEIGG